MRLAVISDLHANLAACEAVFEVIQKRAVDAVICLGDIVGYNAQPAECIALIRKHADYVMAGNHDRDVLRESSAGTRSSARFVQRWTRETLSSEERAYLEALPTHVVTSEFAAAHGAFLSEIYVSGYVTSTMLEENLEALQTRKRERGWPGLVFCGHTHLPMLGVWHNGTSEEYNLKTPVAWSGAVDVVLANPGSVGQPRDNDTRAAFAIVDTELRRCEVLRVPYDMERTIEVMRKQSFPDELIERLKEGR